MVSTELLRRFPFFGFLGPAQLRDVAMISEEITVAEGEVLFHIGDKAAYLYFLLAGSVELHYVVIDENLPQLRKDFMVGTINAGEVVGISAVLAPDELTATAVCTMDSKLLKIDGEELLALCDDDPELAYGLMRQVALATMERLSSTRVLLAAATASV